MSVSHTIGLVYSGGGASPISANVVAVGQSELNYNTACAGAGTTTLAPPLVIDPDAGIESYMFSASGGNATLKFTASGGASIGIALTDIIASSSPGQPVIAWRSDATDLISGVPTSADTYTLSVVVPDSSSITFAGRMVLE